MVLPYSSHHHQDSRKQLNLASRYHSRGWKHYMNSDFDSSFHDWRRAVKIRQIVLGDNDASTMVSLDLIGCVLQRMGVSESKRKQYLKNLFKSIRHEIKGDNLGYEGKTRKALKEYQKSMKLEERIIGRDHPVVTALYRKMASALKELGQMDHTRLVYCDALAV